jgi:hypothetical protein
MFVGFLAAGLIGFSIQWISFHWQRVQQPGEPQLVVLPTEETPMDIFRRALRSGCLLLVVVVVVFGGCWLLASGAL